MIGVYRICLKMFTSINYHPNLCLFSVISEEYLYCCWLRKHFFENKVVFDNGTSSQRDVLISCSIDKQISPRNSRIKLYSFIVCYELVVLTVCYYVQLKIVILMNDTIIWSHLSRGVARCSCSHVVGTRTLNVSHYLWVVMQRSTRIPQLLLSSWSTSFQECCVGFESKDKNYVASWNLATNYVFRLDYMNVNIQRKKTAKGWRHSGDWRLYNGGTKRDTFGQHQRHENPRPRERTTTSSNTAGQKVVNVMKRHRNNKRLVNP